jgi:hypothetical protein
MLYQNPTLFGVAFASRLFRQIDYLSSFEVWRDLESPANCEGLLEWLNKWGCRIATESFSERSPKLAAWFRKWNPQLPHASVELVGTRDPDLDILADAYDGLLTAGFGPTAASKTLFAIRPETAMAWDRAIRAGFNLNGGSRQNYRAMLALSKREAEMLIADAARCGIPDHRSIPDEVGSPDRTLARLLDEFHWITIVRRHQIPTSNELKRWVGWAL